MKFCYLLLVSVVVTKALYSCNDTPSEPQLCKYDSVNPKEFVLVVDTDIKIIDVNHVSESDKSITLFMFFMIYWYNSAYGVTSASDERTNDTVVEIAIDDYDKIYRPTITFMNAYEIEKIKLFGSDHFNYFWFYNYWTKFEYAEYLKVKLGCDFDFQTFPFDSHTCYLKYYSPGFDSGMLNFNTPYIYEVHTTYF